ncbi:MAG: formylglycine-generating enzyme family protein [Nostoc sp.]
MGELERYSHESPQHQGTVPAFFMGKYPVTQAQWQAVASLPQVNKKLDPDPSHFEGANRPVETVSWDDAVEFCDRLSQVLIF